jgi:hypothetical protein
LPEAAGGAPGTHSSYVCDKANDYQAFETLPALRAVNDLAPRKEQTKDQREDLTPGDRLWQLQETPDTRCSADGLLELRYTAAGSSDFGTARNRMTVTLAPAARLLDPLTHERMSALASALDEALTELRSKTCTETGGPCDLKRSPHPLRFPGSPVQYSVASEFKKIGQRGWTWYSAQGPYQTSRTRFTTSDGRFDVEVLVETMDKPTGSFHLLPERISDDYDAIARARANAAARGGSGG